jgi:hypothetical protein
MMSLFERPSAVRRAPSSMVGWGKRMRTIGVRRIAALAWRCPPQSSRCLFVRPDDAGTGQVPQSFANAASDLMRSGLSPNTMSITGQIVSGRSIVGWAKSKCTRVHR